MQREANAHGPNSAEAIRLFGLGFVTLFLELALIRDLAGSIWNLGIFPNLVLLAVFVGLGLCFILHSSLGTRGTRVAFHLAPLAMPALVSGVALLKPSIPGFGKNLGVVGGVLFFASAESSSSGVALLLDSFGLVAALEAED